MLQVEAVHTTTSIAQYYNIGYIAMPISYYMLPIKNYKSSHSVQQFQGEKIDKFKAICHTGLIPTQTDTLFGKDHHHPLQCFVVLGN